jgi:hypothetical protein
MNKFYTRKQVSFLASLDYISAPLLKDILLFQKDVNKELKKKDLEIFKKLDGNEEKIQDEKYINEHWR